LKTKIAIILSLIGFLNFGQEIKLDENGKLVYKVESEILDSLYVKALNNRFDLILQSGLHYVEMNEYGNRIKNSNVSDRYKFLSTNELIDLSIKEKRTIYILRVVHKVISKDTIDINFEYIGFKGVRKLHFYKGIRFKKAEITVGCGATIGYQPDLRFALDSLKNEWEIIENRFIRTNEE